MHAFFGLAQGDPVFRRKIALAGLCALDLLRSHTRGAEIAAAEALRILLVECCTRRRFATRLAGENALPFRRDRGRTHIVTPLTQIAIAHMQTLRADATAADEDVAADRGD